MPRARPRISSRAPSISSPISACSAPARAGVALHQLGHQLELHAQRDEPLLGAVVEVPLDALALDVGRRENSCLRLAQLAH
jgi:hypothetical protein